MRNYRPKQSFASEHHDTPRNPTEHGGAPTFGYSALESAIFLRTTSKFSNIFCARRPLSPTPRWGRVRNSELPTRTKRRRGATEFGYLALESAIFRMIHSEFCNIFLLPAPLFQQLNGEGAKYETTDQTEGRRGTPRNSKERYGTCRNAHIFLFRTGIRHILVGSFQIL